VEQRAAVNVGRADQLAQIPLRARFVLDVFLAERVGLVGKMPAENDGVRPYVQVDVGERVGALGAQERTFHSRRNSIQEVRRRTETYPA
jgi:hypothetical protein